MFLLMFSRLFHSALCSMNERKKVLEYTNNIINNSYINYDKLLSHNKKMMLNIEVNSS